MLIAHPAAKPIHFLILGMLTSATTAANTDDAAVRKMQFRADTPVDAHHWQEKSREMILGLLNLSDLQETRQADGNSISFDVKTLSSEDMGKFTRSEIEFNS